MRYIALFLLALALLAGCGGGLVEEPTATPLPDETATLTPTPGRPGTGPTSDPDTVVLAELGQPFTVAVGQTAVVSEDVVVMVVELLEDSRCPADVFCIWAGRVRVLVEVQAEGQTGQAEVILGALLQDETAAPRISGHTVELLEAQPYPLSSQDTAEADYRFTLAVE
jgi:hypothetical protein